MILDEKLKEIYDSKEDLLRDECGLYLYSAIECLMSGFYEYARDDAMEAAKTLTKLKHEKNNSK